MKKNLQPTTYNLQKHVSSVGLPSTTFIASPQKPQSGNGDHTTSKNHRRLINKSGAGFTLIEMIVSISLFTVVVMVAVGSLLAIADANRKANALRTVVDNLNFAIESMARNIRTGSKYACEGSGNCLGGGSSFQFTDQNNTPVVYAYDSENNQITIEEGNNDSLAITSPDIEIENLTFYVTGVGDSGGNQGKQPRVVMVVKGQAGILEQTRSSFVIQTTVSQRRVES